MRPDDARLLTLAEAVADGLGVDWADAETRAASPEERELIRELRVLADLAELHRKADEPLLTSLEPPSGVRNVGPALPAEDSPIRPVFRSWGPLQVREEVGTGAFGIVYRAWDTRLDREVALKLLRGIRSTKQDQASAVVQEGRLLAQIRHPNVVTVYGADWFEGCVGLWMEFVNGRTLKEIQQEQGAFSAQEAALLGLDLCRALAAVHKAGFLHRDIKAQNVMREAGGRIVLMDFGAAGFARTGSEVGMTGTPLYLAPEILQGDRPSVRSDLYSLGILFYYLVSGQFPVSGRSLAELRQAHEQEKRTLLRDLRPDLPSAFVRVIDDATAVLPEHRPESAGAMEVLLETAMGLRPRGLNGLVERSLAGLDPRERLQIESIRLAGTPDALATLEPAPPIALLRYRALVGVIGIASTLIVLTLAGFITSTTYNFRLGRVDFAQESPLWWPYWGFRSMVAPLALMGGVAVGFSLLTAACRLTLTTCGPLRRWSEPMRMSIRTLFERLGSTSSAALAQALLFATITALGVFLWRFSGLLEGLGSFMAQQSPEHLAILAPSNRPEHSLYRQLLSLGLFVFGVAWYRLLKLRDERNDRDGLPSLVGGVAVMALTICVLAYPYRTLQFNEGERVSYESQLCYLVGQRGNDALLFCPLQPPPWNRIVRLDDPALKRGQTYENIFAELDRVR